MSQNDTGGRQTRRTFIGALATGSAIGLAGCSGNDDGTPTMSATDEPTDSPTDSPTPTETETETATPEPPAPDVPVLNYALTLEHLENAFYRDGLEEFSDEELMNADALSEYGNKIREKVPGHLQLAGDHEAAHVSAITDTVEKLGGDPVQEANYDTVRHHLDVLADNDVVRASGDNYGAVYLPTDRVRTHWDVVESIPEQLEQP